MTTEVWTPACMSADELATWQSGRNWADRPCLDCLLGFAVEMRAVGRCNGTPGGVQEDELEEAQEERPMTTSVRAQVSAPCDRCIHLEVCARRETIAELASVPVEVIQLAKGLSFAVSVEIECDAFLAAKKSRVDRPAGEGPKSYWTPERRQAQAARLIEFNARRAAERKLEAATP